MERWNTKTRLGVIAYDVLFNEFHRPLVKGKANRKNIEDGILDAVYKGELEAMNKADVDYVCDIIDDFLKKYYTN